MQVPTGDACASPASTPSRSASNPAALLGMPSLRNRRSRTSRCRSKSSMPVSRSAIRRVRSICPLVNITASRWVSITPLNSLPTFPRDIVGTVGTFGPAVGEKEFERGHRGESPQPASPGAQICEAEVRFRKMLMTFETLSLYCGSAISVFHTGASKKAFQCFLCSSVFSPETK